DERTVRVAFGAGRRAPTGAGLSGGISASGGPVEVAIANDDAPPPRNLPTIAIDDVRDVEESWVLSFRVTLSEASTERVTVDYATVEGTAYGSVDFGDVRARTLVLPPGTTRATIHIAVRDDTRRERDETFGVVLSNPAGATIARGTATGTIINDD
ncbi:MAG: hypothetical protein OXG69_02865, partial [bacterium]|nr:hypothetical protein [bacterium]